MINCCYNTYSPWNKVLEESEGSEKLKIVAQDAILKKLGDMAGLHIDPVSLHGEVCMCVRGYRRF